MFEIVRMSINFVRFRIKILLHGMDKISFGISCFSARARFCLPVITTMQGVTSHFNILLIIP